jgi:SWI/SNF-related matrix-associated actin-dependent regulator 1 of chromatin subfamily A
MRFRQSPQEAGYVNGLRAAYDKGFAAAGDPEAAEAGCPYSRWEHRKSWIDGFSAGVKYQISVEDAAGLFKNPHVRKMAVREMNVEVNGKNFILRVPAAQKQEVANLMAYRGLTFSTSASSRQDAVLWGTNPYALADLAEGVPELAAYKTQIDLSRALNGKGTRKLPPGKELWDYQKATLDYLLARKGGIDADQPGLGKTPTSIAYCNEREATRVLVIVPASVRIQWGERIREWSTIPNVKVSVMLKVKDGIHPTANYQVISYDAARNPAIMRAIAQSEWDVLICDEAHKMKNIDAITTRAILGNSKGEFNHGGVIVPAIAKYCREHVALTGTLLLNRPSECYVLFRHFDWEAIDFLSEDAFKERYNRQAKMRTIEGKHFTLESTSLENELQNRLRVNIMARHEKKDVLTLMKPPRYSIVTCEENGDVRGALAVEGLLGLSIDEIQTTKDFEILGHIAEARRLMGLALAPQIIDYAIDFLEGTEEKLTIFAWHIGVLDLFEESLARFGTARVDGRKTATARQKAVDDFIGNAKTRVFIGNIQAAGTGLDGLQTVCSRCYLAEPDWVPANNEQAVSRLDRIGQPNDVNAEIFVAPGSISEKILVKALEKLNVIHRVLDAKD